mgnify:CR=1 FL=1
MVFSCPGGCNSIVPMLKYVAYDIFCKGVIETVKYLGHSFKKLHFLMEHAINQRLVELDLTTAQGHAIGYLRRAKEPPCARDIETVYGLSHATVSGILSRMESKGFIEQRPDPKDRRIKRIYLLEKGTACSESIWRHIEESEGIMAQGFSPEELEQFRTYLRRAISNLEQSSGKNHCNREE